jgi:hypothetical protein
VIQIGSDDKRNNILVNIMARRAMAAVMMMMNTRVASLVGTMPVVRSMVVNLVEAMVVNLAVAVKQDTVSSLLVGDQSMVDQSMANRDMRNGTEKMGWRDDTDARKKNMVVEKVVVRVMATDDGTMRKKRRRIMKEGVDVMRAMGVDMGIIKVPVLVRAPILHF